MQKTAQQIAHEVITKVAVELQDHQQRVLDKLDAQDALLVYHGLGSGKTLTALSAAAKFKGPLNVVGPASLKFNFEKEKAKHKLSPRVDTYTYNKPPEEVQANALLAFDEAHRMGRLSSKRSHLPDELRGRKTLYLTGTPIRNTPDELIPLMRGLGIDIPRDPKGFSERYITYDTVNPSIMERLRGVKPGAIARAQNINELKGMLKGKVDYHAPSSEGYPSVNDEDIRVEMTPRQEEAYLMALNEDPSLRYKIQHGMAPSKTESKRLNAFMTATRQISNIPGGYNLSAGLSDAPKLQRAAEEIQKRIDTDPNYRGVTYSNYLGHGIDPMSQLLEARGIPSAQFTGRINAKEKERIVNDYNEGKIKQLLISGAGGEGLDLKGTKLMQLLEPHWNDPQLEQVKGRAIRYQSHAHLPEEERRVDVQRYIATPREHGLIFKERHQGTDEYLRMLSQQKKDLNEQFLGALRESS